MKINVANSTEPIACLLMLLPVSLRSIEQVGVFAIGAPDVYAFNFHVSSVSNPAIVESLEKVLK